MKVVVGRRAGSRLAALSVALLCGATAAVAAEWIVDDDGPADFLSLQAAIDAPYVVSGDVVRVRPGLYPTNLYLARKDLAIISSAGPFATVLDGGASGSVVILENRGAGTRVEGFTIRNGRDANGGGVLVVGGAPVVTRNIIEGNEAVGGFLGYGYGGGIEIYGGAPTITRNVIRGNRALDGGGGIDVYYSGPSSPGTCCPLLSHNTIAGNEVVAGGGIGGGVLVFASEPVITASIVAGNRADAGGGIFVYRPAGVHDQPAASEDILHGNAPDDVAGDWRLPAGNAIADPRLGQGDRIDLWPRSDSPALDVAGGEAWPDLRGTTGAIDGDLDGAAAADAGAIEALGEITTLVVSGDPAAPGAALLSWDAALDPAVRYKVYAGDGDPFRTDGGRCLAAALTTTAWRDAEPPAVGTARFYLVTGEGAIEGSRGVRSDGSARPSGPACDG